MHLITLFQVSINVKHQTYQPQNLIIGLWFVAMSDREPTRWQHNRIYPYPINPSVYTYNSRLYCCETVDAHCSNIIKS